MKKKKKYFSVLVIAIMIIVIGFTLPFVKKEMHVIHVPKSIAQSGEQYPSSPKVVKSELNVSGSGKCEDLRTEIDALFEEARICQSDNDCVIENKGFYCPFSCYQIHNKNYDIGDILKKAMEFQKSQCFLCEYSCMEPPAQSDLKCEENRCIDNRYFPKK